MITARPSGKRLNEEWKVGALHALYRKDGTWYNLLERFPGALLRLGRALVEQYCGSFRSVPKRIVLDIDDTFDQVHGGQQLRLFNAYYDGSAGCAPCRSPCECRATAVAPGKVTAGKDSLAE